MYGFFFWFRNILDLLLRFTDGWGVCRVETAFDVSTVER